MRSRILFTVSAFILILSMPAAAQFYGMIGLFEDEAATSICGDVWLYYPYDIHILACGAGVEVDAVEFVFRVDNLPDSTGYPAGTVTCEYAADTVTGDIRTGVSLSYDAPIDLGIVSLGKITLMSYSDDWAGEDVMLLVQPHSDAQLLGCYSAEREFHELGGGWFVLNGYIHYPGSICMTPAAAESWSDIKSLY